MNELSNKTTPKPLHSMFTSVPPRYDLINHIVTLGMDARWRNAAARECLKGQPQRILDLGCGTGDLAITITRLAQGEIELTGLDYSQPMLERAREKAAKLAPGREITFVEGDIGNMPFLDGYFDCVGISFAFRNITYKNPNTTKYLSEVLRVLKPEGRFVIVESSQPSNQLTRSLFNLYLRLFVFNVGWWISGDRGAYHYLAESVSRFYTPVEVKRLLLNTGFSKVSYRPLFFGAAGIHVAEK